MSEQKQFTIELDQLQGYEFKVRFDLDGVEPLLVDEPAPIGQGQGPNPSRLVAAAAANCLGASLLYCVSKNQPSQGSLRASATCTLGRNEKGRLRITGIDVRLELAATLEQAARTKRCLDLFEDFCVVSASLRDGFPVSVAVLNERGEILHRGVA